MFTLRKCREQTVNIESLVNHSGRPAQLTHPPRHATITAMREQNFGKLVEARIAERRLTNYRVANDVGITRQTVGNLIAGKPVKSHVLAAVFAYLDLIVVAKEGK